MADHVHPGDDWLTGRMRTLAHKFPTDQQIDKSVGDFLHKLFGGGERTIPPRTVARTVPGSGGQIRPVEDPDGLAPTDQWAKVPRSGVPAPRLPEGWRQLKDSGAAKPLVPRKESLGIDDPAIKAQLDEMMARIKATPDEHWAKDDPRWKMDQPPLNLQLFGHWSNPNTFDERSDPGGIYPDFKKGVPLPSQGPRRVGGGSPEDLRQRLLKEAETRKLLEANKPKGEGWTDGGTLTAVPEGAQPVSLATSDSPYDIWFKEKLASLARQKAEIDAGVAEDNKSKTPAQLQRDRDITASTYPRDMQPYGRLSTQYEETVPKANRTWETLIGRYQKPDTGSARNPVGSADKRLRGKRGVKPGEM